MEYSTKVNPNLKGLFGALALFAFILLYALPALGSRNALWFWPALGAEPSQIITYRGGERTVYLPGTPGYQTLAPLCTEALQNVTGLDDSGLSPSTIAQIRAEGNAVEVFYPREITIPGANHLAKPNQVLIPLDKKYEDWEVAYTGNNGQYWAQGLRIRSTYQKIIDAFQQLGPR